MIVLALWSGRRGAGRLAVGAIGLLLRCLLRGGEVLRALIEVRRIIALARTLGLLTVAAFWTMLVTLKVDSC